MVGRIAASTPRRGATTDRGGGASRCRRSRRRAASRGERVKTQCSEPPRDRGGPRVCKGGGDDARKDAVGGSRRSRVRPARGRGLRRRRRRARRARAGDRAGGRAEAGAAARGRRQRRAADPLRALRSLRARRRRLRARAGRGQPIPMATASASATPGASTAQNIAAHDEMLEIPAKTRRGAPIEVRVTASDGHPRARRSSSRPSWATASRASRAS